MGRYISNTSSYQDNELLLLKQGFAKNRKEFLAAGTNTWTINRGVIARVRVWGGGGGGGGGYYRDSGGNGIVGYVPGAGGAAGGAAEVILRLNAGTYNITVGAGGAGGKGWAPTSGSGPTIGTDGKRGGSSSFHTYITCTGGLGGSVGDPTGGVLGGVGGTVTFNWTDFNGLLYANGQFGGAGGSFRRGCYSNGQSGLPFNNGPEGGAGESGGYAGYALYGLMDSLVGRFMGGGGGGYNAPFIYGLNMATQVNSGRGVGTGGAGALGSNNSGYAGNAGAVVIEWN